MCELHVGVQVGSRNVQVKDSLTNTEPQTYLDTLVSEHNSPNTQRWGVLRSEAYLLQCMQRQRNCVALVLLQYVLWYALETTFDEKFNINNSVEMGLEMLIWGTY